MLVVLHTEYFGNSISNPTWNIDINVGISLKNSKVFEQKGNLLNFKTNIDPRAVVSQVKPGWAELSQYELSWVELSQAEPSWAELSRADIYDICQKAVKV